MTPGLSAETVEAKVVRHTPGPWNLNNRYRLSTHVTGFNGPDGSRLGYIGINASYKSPEWRAEQMANARLVVASPEMILALESVFHDCIGRTPEDDLHMPHPATIRLVHEALRKAGSPLPTTRRDLWGSMINNWQSHAGGRDGR